MTTIYGIEPSTGTDIKYLFRLIGFYTWRGLSEVVHHNIVRVNLKDKTDVHKTGIGISQRSTSPNTMS